MTKRFPAGSEWRKWDLHVHLPGTKLSDGYDAKDGKPDWDRFADILEASDVAVIGITDYFCATASLAFIRYFKARHAKSEKLLLVNVELRLNETVNRNVQPVDFHVIFRDTVADTKIEEFLSKLKTQLTDAQRRHKLCSELAGNDYSSATVTRDDINEAFRETFGEGAEPADYLIYVAPANNNGLRAEAGNQRKATLADEIDKVVHAIFGKDQSNFEYYLRTDRFEDKSQPSKPKPVFGGCDAHNFMDLEQWLGKSVSSDSTHQVVTWVKADPTFEGLQQTLVEPRDRVALSDLHPDDKDLYRVIRKVTFEGSTDFPQEIVINPNLNAIIGSRSSGKSALLAHIAHAVDPVYTVRQQMTASNLKENEIGPAAGYSWGAVRSTACKVEWADGPSSGGSIIYIPQNWLFQISDNPREVTDKIEPVLKARYGAYFREYERLQGTIKTANDAIRKSVSRWFELSAELDRFNAEIKQVGDKSSITKARDDIKANIETLRTEAALSAEDLEKYQTVVNDIETKRSRIEEIAVESEQIQDYVIEGLGKKFSSAPGGVTVETYLSPSPDEVPEQLAHVLSDLIDESGKNLVTKAESAIVTFSTALATAVQTLTADIKKLETDNKDLLAKHKANATLDELVKRQKAQQNSLDKIEKLESRRTAVISGQETACDQVSKSLTTRGEVLATVHSSFAAERRVLDELIFDMAVALDAETIRALSEPFRKNEKGTFLKGTGESDRVVDIAKAQADPKAFMQDLSARKQKLNQGHTPADIAQRVLTATPEVRFMAELDKDRIGGFERPTMTPGKQALFALTLILGETEDRWTLLIDQPEDDLDSRSIYRVIVKYLVQQKKQRQIILVTHNANLVVGADAEEILVANRHGDDRKNKGNRRFDYLTGSLEHSDRNKTASFDLDKMGIREHAVEILDGGEEAFQKRRDKYKL